MSLRSGHGILDALKCQADRVRHLDGEREKGRRLSKVAIKRALVSVYDKTGLEVLARALHTAGIEIVSTGSTAAVLTAAGIPVTSIETVTGFPECLDGRVKTLHPGVHAGLLADLGNQEHLAQLDELKIAPFQLLVSNLYPFEQTVADGATPQECVDQIDIGGPAMVRAAAKNHASVAVITSPSMYGDVEAAIADGGFTLAQRRRLAAVGYARTAAYDAAVASWFAAAYAPDQTARDSGWPDTIGAVWTRGQVLRYGENPHQRAALYLRGAAPGGSMAEAALGQGAASGGAGGRSETGRGAGRFAVNAGIAGAEQLHGKAMSYNNYVDADAARRAAFDFAEPCVAIMKHSNPCGIAVAADLAEAHRRAHACDPASAYGGVIAANGVVTARLAEQIAEAFTEVIIAPGFEPAALDILTRKKNQRLLRCAPPEAGPGTEWRPVSGGMLVQSADRVTEPGDGPEHWRLAAGSAANAEVLRDLAFAWRACRAVKSNAILLAADRATVGIGMGQVNRVDSARLAVTRAAERAAGAVAASDAYFPFADGLQVLADAGVRAIAEPGGSIRDAEVIAAAAAAGITLYLTGVRHFFH
jgi:phosphoribosylaminoimidazolecarboxamide formyltransferase/IMP cyclohydrolase